ncbi:unnamed protein product, partial [Didymodactylos carnosus]
KNDMLDEARLFYKENDYELKIISEFDENYISNDAIRWYTRESFLYRLLNKALRTENIDIIFKFRFFIVDLYNQLKQEHIKFIHSLSSNNN